MELILRKYLAVNVGSTSKRYALYSNKEEILNLYWHNGDKDKFNELLKYKNDIKAIAVRVVAPGNYFTEHRIIDKVYLNKLKDAEKIAPLHIRLVLKEISRLKKFFPNIKLVGISDSNFYKNMLQRAKDYALNKKIADKYGIHRYGYHGVSMSSIVSYVRSLGKMPNRIIVCHLGGGSSITAIKNGKAFDTSMGFTPLEGVYGSTRVGDIDAGALLFLFKHIKGNLGEYLNYKCGLEAVGGSGDMKELIKREHRGDKKAKLAIDMFTYKIKKFIGAYTAALDGLDMLVFSGAIGTNSSIIRSEICNDLEYLGINLDKPKNKSNENSFINTRDSKVKILIFKTNEMEEMIKSSKKVLNLH